MQWAEFDAEKAALQAAFDREVAALHAKLRERDAAIDKLAAKIKVGDPARPDLAAATFLQTRFFRALCTTGDSCPGTGRCGGSSEKGGSPAGSAGVSQQGEG
jgi:hypothetical protein